MFIDYAELMAEDEILMSMQDWVDQTNQFLINASDRILMDEILQAVHNYLEHKK